MSHPGLHHTLSEALLVDARNKIVHSSKTTRLGFSVCMESSILTSPKGEISTYFYELYPSSILSQISQEGNNLQQIITAGWDPTSNLVAKMLDKSWKNNGLLIVNKKKSKANKIKHGKSTNKYSGIS